MLTFSSARGWHIGLPKARLSKLGEKNRTELILRDMLLILNVCISTLKHFRLKSLPPMCGNHEIALIRPADDSPLSPNTLDPNGDENKPITFTEICTETPYII